MVPNLQDVMFTQDDCNGLPDIIENLKSKRGWVEFIEPSVQQAKSKKPPLWVAFLIGHDVIGTWFQTLLAVLDGCS
jgi:hypothetical protein